MAGWSARAPARRWRSATLRGRPVLIALFGLALTIAFLRAATAAILLGIVATTVFANRPARGLRCLRLPRRTRAFPDKMVRHAGLQPARRVLVQLLLGDGRHGRDPDDPGIMMADFFDTMGTLVGVGSQAGYLNEKGELPDSRSRCWSTRWRPSPAARPRLVGDDLHRVGVRCRRRRAFRAGGGRDRHPLPARCRSRRWWRSSRPRRRPRR